MRLEDSDGEDIDGMETIIGGRFSVMPLLSLFAEYRLLNLEGDSGDEVDIDGFRLGARLSF